MTDNLLDKECVPDESFPLVLEYFEGSKGKSRKTLIDKAMKVIEKYEKKAEEESEEIDEDPTYSRARELVQFLPSET